MWRIDVLDGQDKLRRDDEHANRAAEDDEVSLTSPAHALDEHEHVDEQQGTPQRERDEKDEMPSVVEGIGNERAIVDGVLRHRGGAEIRDAHIAHAGKHARCLRGQAALAQEEQQAVEHDDKARQRQANLHVHPVPLPS